MEHVILLLSLVWVAGTLGSACTLGTGVMLGICTLITCCMLGVAEGVVTSLRKMLRCPQSGWFMSVHGILLPL